MVTKTPDVGAILFDGKPLTTSWSAVPNWSYSYAAFPVTHGAHTIAVADGSSARFGAYAYGHSMLERSTSGYGYTVGFDGINARTNYSFVSRTTSVFYLLPVCLFQQ